jgi:hypothetical protein
VDVYIADEARRSFEALNALAPRQKHFGFLIGHKRGHRFIVEKIFPAPAGLKTGLRNLPRFDDLFARRAIGFYASGDLARVKAGLRQPAASGRLLLAFRAAGRAPAFKAYAVDFDGRFRFLPLPLILEEDD